ncbi:MULTISPECIES: acyltransferase [unclassified Bradyrhizobium]|uniref:acyltransferase n=1 Tax=unclassified Bradyrhizobium TaxID=2631580 RepID=UPI0028E545CD|nr:MULTISPECIES: acyltransferase [unclassified Bradyrhizobium]
MSVADEALPRAAHVAVEKGTVTAVKAGAAGRNGGIDALRAAVTLLVVSHHTAITYGAIGGWYYKEIAPSETLGGALLVLFCTVNQAWFMGLFFLLAGYYTPPSYRRDGLAGFVRERLVRLGIPLAVYFVVLHPLTVALAQTANGRSFSRVFEYLWTHGRFEPGPLWFAEALLIFAATWLLWQWVQPLPRATTKRAFPSDAVLLVTALLIGFAAFLLRLVWPVGVNVAFLQLGYFASYIALFAAGCAAADGRWLEHIPEAQKKTWLRVALIAVPVFPLVGFIDLKFHVLPGNAEGGLNVQALVYAFWEPFVAWGFLLGLLTAFQRRFARLTDGWTRLARRAYLIYIIHPPILVGTALAWRDIAAPGLLKFVITGSVACTLCYLAAGLLLRVPGVARVV